MKRQSSNRTRLSPAERLALHVVATRMIEAAKTGDPDHLLTEGRHVLTRFRQWMARNRDPGNALARLRESDLDFLPPTRRRTTRKVIPCEHLVESLHP